MTAPAPASALLLLLAGLASCEPAGAPGPMGTEAPLASLASLPGESRTAALQSAADASDRIDSSRRTAIVQAASRVAPAVVNVSVLRTERARPRSSWESLFMPPRGSRQTAGFGSGVIVRGDGIILTNDHVVRDAERIKVSLPDGRDFDAELVGTDQAADIAVLRIAGDGLPVAPVGTSAGLYIGEWAVAIGNPFANYFSDAEPTVTAGVVSATGRNIVPSSQQEGFYLGMIQTDASINPGNSGGALVNALGEVIGINASIFSRSGGSEGLGFAIPIDRAMRIADDLVQHGEVRRAWLGLDVEPVEADAWGRTRGVRVSRITEGSPAHRASIQVGDRLLGADGRSLAAPLDFEAVLLDLRAGDTVELAVEGRSRPATVTAAALPSVAAQRVTVLDEMQLITLTPQVRAERGVASENGALIASISDRLSGQLGLRPGDVIVQINRARVVDAPAVATTFEALRGRGPIRIYFERNGQYAVRDFYWR